MVEKNNYYFPINEVERFINEIFLYVYGEDHTGTNEILSKYFSSFRDDLYCYAEYPYVEKFYRDNFYNFYSTKHKKYNRDCIRISFFSIPVENSSFRDEDEIEKLKIKGVFLGCSTIRPTPPNIIGRSLISPDALKISPIDICQTKYKFMVNGIRLTTQGFPHNMQNLEVTRCAEVSICNIMDYLSNKYQDYRLVLPSSLRKTMTNTSEVRQLPSDGLRINHISYALKEFGLEPLKYDRAEKIYAGELDNIICTYIESGIPVIGVIDLKAFKYDKGEFILVSTEEIESENPPDVLNKQHTFLIIGKKALDGDLKIEEFPSYEPIIETAKQYTFYDYSDFVKDVVVSDDCTSPYSILKLKNPDNFKSDEDILNMITGIVVPLPPKVYVDASKAKDIAFNIAASLLDLTLNLDSETFILRILLTSTRSFKEHISKNFNIDSDNRDKFINFPTPKFIWLCEVLSKDSYTTNECVGFFTLDATESNEYAEMTDILLFGALFDTIYLSDIDNKELKTVHLQSFSNRYALYQNLNEQKHGKK